MSLHPDLAYGQSSLVQRFWADRPTVKPMLEPAPPVRTECPACHRMTAVEERPIDLWSSEEGRWFRVVQKRCYRADQKATARGAVPTCGAITIVSREPFEAPPPVITSRGESAMPTGKPVCSKTKQAILSHVREGMTPKQAIQAEVAQDAVSVSTVINWCRYEGIRIPSGAVATPTSVDQIPAETQSPQEPAQEARGEAIDPPAVAEEVEAPSGSPEAILEAALVAETPEVLKKPINQVVIRVYPDPPSPPSSRDIVVRLLQSNDIAEFLRLDETTREALENLWVATEGVA